jgi:hypothetical protein
MTLMVEKLAASFINPFKFVPTHAGKVQGRSMNTSLLRRL